MVVSLQHLCSLLLSMHFLRNVEHVYAENKTRQVLVYLGQFQDGIPLKISSFWTKKGVLIRPCC